ncbi:MAG: rhomboid family intramembrane serine protease, partial [Cytophagaceae bacterium]
MSVDPASTADLLVIATDARSVSESEAVAEMVAVSRALVPMEPLLIYKKVDSVLRGHIMAETLAQIAVLRLKKALVVSANPALGRTIVNGQYYVQGALIHQTHFSEDPEFPITESDVHKRFSANVDRLTVQPHYGSYSEAEIIIGEVADETDLQAWVRRLDAQTLPCGGSGFFTAILDLLPDLFPSMAPDSTSSHRPLRDFGTFAIQSAIFEGRVWEFITFQFLHANILHLLFNCIGIFFFGPFLERWWGSLKFLIYYLLCGAGGAAFFTLLLYIGLLPGDGIQSGLIGASAGFYGILIGVAFIAPNIRVALLFPPVELSMRQLAIALLSFSAIII